RAPRPARGRRLRSTERSSTSRFPSGPEGTEGSGRRPAGAHDETQTMISAASTRFPRIVFKAAVPVVLAAGIASTAAPASERTHVIAPGVKVLGTRVGGLTAPPAERRIQRAVSRPITIVYRGETMVVTPQQFGAQAGIDRAVRAALSATPRSRI